MADERGMRTGWVSQQDATRLIGRGIKATFAQEEGAFDRDGVEKGSDALTNVIMAKL